MALGAHHPVIGNAYTALLQRAAHRLRCLLPLRPRHPLHPRHQVMLLTIGVVFVQLSTVEPSPAAAAAAAAASSSSSSSSSSATAAAAAATATAATQREVAAEQYLVT